VGSVISTGPSPVKRVMVQTLLAIMAEKTVRRPSGDQSGGVSLRELVTGVIRAISVR